MPQNNIIIRFATCADVGNIMTAIDRYWDATHILAHNKDFFLYMFGSEDDAVNMAIAVIENTQEVVGFLGCVKYSSNSSCDISPIFWKAVDGYGEFLGLKLLLFIIKNVKHNLVFCLGLNPETIPIYQRLKYTTGQMEHYYRIQDKTDYKIAKICSKKIYSVQKSGTKIVLLDTKDLFKEKIGAVIFKERCPQKDTNYIYHRYYEHPFYKYDVYGIIPNNEKEIKSILVCRSVEKFGVKALRIIDYIGNEEYFSYIGMHLQNLLDQYDYEYIDCYCYGMSEKIMNTAGFVRRTADDENIIPNHFEPFIQKNAEILFYSSSFENLMVFKGDADQDQPRLNDRGLIQ